MLNYFLAFFASFFLAILIAPIVINLSKKLKAQQTILNYVEAHQGKQGTPTLGGIIFIIPTIIISLIFLRKDFTLALISLAGFFGFATLGFLDDFIKIKFKQNLGLRAYQKVIGQLGISLIIAVFCYKSNLVSSEILLPFTNKMVNIGWFIIPLVVLVFIATTNSVNLTDGLDGLATGTSIIYFIAALILFFSLLSLKIVTGLLFVNELTNLIIVCLCMLGSLLAFLCFNGFPAKIFMGDTGSLAIGGLIASVMCLSKTMLFIPLFGIMFVVSSVSVIIQVLHYKRTKKRVFLMAPLHHHFQNKGVHENKIVIVYIIITILVSSLTLVLNYLLI